MSTSKTEPAPPSISEIEACACSIAPYIIETPMHRWSGAFIENYLGADSEVHLKLELFQRTGTFKPRAAIHNVLSLSDEERRCGVTAVSSGNHAIATAYAAASFGIDAKVVMLSSSNPARVEAARRYGAEIVLAPDAERGFEMVEEIVSSEGKNFIHPYEGWRVTAATATCGVELIRSVEKLDAVIVPIGGGGLCSGIAVAVKQLRPECKVYGVEPVGAALMSASLEAGEPLQLANQSSIADSLIPPMTLPYGFSMCRRFVDEILLVEDDQIAAAVAILFSELKLAVEAAAAVSTAAALGPLRERLRGKCVALIVCGTNIDVDGFCQLARRGHKALERGVLG